MAKNEMAGMRRVPRESGLKVFVARNLGAMACGECGRVLLKSEVETQWRLHYSPPLCADCVPAGVYGRDPAEVAREDAEIQRRREAFPLH
jgi:hypothetical protein